MHAVRARQFFGLPNVEPMQAAVLEQFQKKISRRSTASRSKGS
jgi:hypothetical protein